MNTVVTITSDPLDDMGAVLMFLAQAEAKHDFEYVHVGATPYHGSHDCTGEDCEGASGGEVTYIAQISGPIRVNPNTPLNQPEEVFPS